MNVRAIWTGLIAVSIGLGLAACERQGTMERAGEEVDEAVDTLKRGGDESAANKVDDAMDEARGAVEEATEPNE